MVGNICSTVEDIIPDSSIWILMVNFHLVLQLVREWMNKSEAHFLYLSQTVVLTFDFFHFLLLLYPISHAGIFMVNFHLVLQLVREWMNKSEAHFLYLSQTVVLTFDFFISCYYYTRFLTLEFLCLISAWYCDRSVKGWLLKPYRLI